MALSARPSTAFRTLAVASSVLLACTTVRAPVSTIAPVIPVRDGQAEPQVELWLEGNRTATPEEAAQASAEARAALDEALAGRTSDNPDDLLVVRAQGVTLTPGHKSDQKAAVAGVILGAVVIVVATVILVVTSGGKSSGGPKPPALPAKAPGGAMAHAVPAAPRMPAPTFRPMPPPPPVVRPAALAPPPRVAPPVPARPPAAGVHPLPPPPPPGVPGTTVGVYVGVEVPLGPVPPAAPAAPEGYLNAQPPPQRPAGLDAPLDAPPPGSVAVAPLPEPQGPPTVDQLELPPLQPLPVETRGFWDGGTLHLEATVVDRATGQPRWRKTVDRKADPRDHAAVKAAVDALLANDGWVPAY